MWSEDQIKLLKEMWSRGHNGNEIAAALGPTFTRGMVASKAHYLGLPLRGWSSLTQSFAARKLSPKPENSATIPVCPTSGKNRSASPGVRLADLTATSCRWPFGDPKDPAFRFCGKRADRQPYCTQHAKVAYQPKTVKTQSSDPAKDIGRVNEKTRSKEVV